MPRLLPEEIDVIAVANSVLSEFISCLASSCNYRILSTAISLKRALENADSAAGSAPYRIAGASASAWASARVTPLWQVAAKASRYRTDYS
jgi:hypothetical protein